MSYTRKLLLLGGSAQQVIAIETAKRMGLYTVLCDYLPDNPGQYYADRFYQVSTTDKESVLRIAKDEKVDGIIAYASDPAAPIAAFVSERLGLPTNPSESVSILCNKEKFREFLRSNSFNCPTSKGYSCVKDVLLDCDSYSYPVIVKPVDSSGSKGVTVLYSRDGLEDAVSFALSYSRKGRIVVEDFIDNKYDYIFGGDIFVSSGSVVIWGLMVALRNHSNPLVPVGEMFPAQIDSLDYVKVKKALQCLVDKLHIDNGCINVEVMVDKHGKVYLIDIGPRAGGNMIPVQLSDIYGVDIVEMSIKAALGDENQCNAKVVIPYYASYVLHSDKEGVFDSIVYSEDIKDSVYKECCYVSKGDAVEKFDNASKALGILFLKFESLQEMCYKMQHIDSYINVKIKMV